MLDDDLRHASGGRAAIVARARATEQARPLRGEFHDVENAVWRCLGPANIPGSMLSIAFDPADPSVIYAGAASGGVWKSVDDGLSWFPIGDQLPTLSIGAIGVSPVQHGTLITGTGGPLIHYDGLLAVGILRSPDGGATWEPTNVVADPYAGRTGYHAVEANADGVFLAASMDGLLRSDDDGRTWTKVVPDGNWTDVKWRPGCVDSALAVREYGGAFISDDAGRTFHPVTDGLPQAADMGGLGKIGWSRSDPRVAYLQLSAADSFTVLGIYGTFDGGASWQLRSRPTYFLGFQGFYNNSIAVDPSNPARVFVGGLSLNVSTDSARTWRYIGRYIHNEHHWMGFHPTTSGEAWIATEGGVYRSGDGGTSWSARHQGLVTIQFYHSCSGLDSTIAYAGAHGNGMPQYRGTPDWVPRPGGDGMICHCSPTNPFHVYGEHQFGYHLVSWDGMATYYDTNTGLSGPSRFTAPLDLDTNDSLHLVTATKTGIYSSGDGGWTWSLMAGASDVVSVSISPVTPRRIWALERSTGIVRTTADGGATWTSSMAAPFAGVGGTKILADPVDSSTAYCTFLRHSAGAPRVVRTTDGGLTWHDASGDLGQGSVHTLAVNPQYPTIWYAGTDLGVWRTVDSGNQWTRHASGLPNVLVTDLQFRRASTELRAATYGRGLWSITTDAVTSAESSSVGAVPSLRLLSSNPAGDVIRMRYVAGMGAAVDLRVYAVSGREVRLLTQERSDGLPHSVEWNTRHVPAGVYFAVMRSNGQQVSRKIVVLR